MECKFVVLVSLYKIKIVLKSDSFLFQRSLIPRLKSWVRKIMSEEENDPLEKADAKPSLAEEAVAAAKAASAAASDVARVSQEMMKTKSEGRC